MYAFSMAESQRTINLVAYNNTPLLVHSSVGQKSNWILCSWSHKAKVKVLTELYSFLEAKEKNLLPSPIRLLIESNSLQP